MHLFWPNVNTGMKYPQKSTFTTEGILLNSVLTGAPFWTNEHHCQITPVGEAVRGHVLSHPAAEIFTTLDMQTHSVCTLCFQNL